MRPLVLALLVALAVLAIGATARAGDPRIEWYTVETPHFRIHYHSGLAQHAQQVANIAELVHARLIPETGWTPKEVVHVIITDNTDFANGSARVVPHKLIRLFATAPDDMSALNDFDEWLLLLFTHEHTHILHIDNITGLPALVNAILGPTYAPNIAQPKWITEGWAVYLESKYSSGGRLRSAMFDMYLRADVLAGRIKTLDHISSDPRRWPGGSSWYLYGGKFVQWVSETYGEDTMAAVSSDYGSNILAWGINRSIRRATGLTYPELWKGWTHHIQEQYAKQVAEVEQRGLREGTRLTHHGRVASHPRFVPACARENGQEALYYYADDGRTTGGVYRVSLPARDQPGHRRLILRSGGSGVMSFDDECNLYADTVAPSRRRYSFFDLYRLPAGTRAPRGIEGNLQRLTTGRRASQPTVSPNGRHIVYVTNRAGTSTLRIADIDGEGTLVNERALVPSARYEQAYTPRFSPDGRHVAYSAWTRGGYRDIRIVEVATGKFYELFHDRASEQQPAWSANGQTLYFTSDRTGIPNIYAFDTLTSQLSQVTNVKIGAYMPEVTPDGKTLYYVGYTYEGFDLYSMPLDRDRWLPALPYANSRPSSQPARPDRTYPVRKYRPRNTLRPYNWDYEVGPSTFGDALVITSGGSDAAGLHSASASITVDTEEGLPSAVASYVYHGGVYDVQLSAYRRAIPRRSWEIGGETPLFVEYVTGVSTNLSVPLPRAFDSQDLSFGYSASSVHAELPVRGHEDPYATVTREPYRGFFGSVNARYYYSNTDRHVYSVGQERGYSVALQTEYAGPETGSESTLISLSGRFRGYVPLPWADNHVLAHALSGGTSGGNFARRGRYFTGGFVDTPLVEAFQDGATASGFVLRGYEPTQYGGTQYLLFNTEYRFPIAFLDRGVSTLPVYARSIAGNLFVDYGGAFNQIDFDEPLEQLQMGLGAELWFDVTMGYRSGAHLRLGYARGTDSDAVDGGQLYVVASGSF